MKSHEINMTATEMNREEGERGSKRLSGVLGRTFEYGGSHKQVLRRGTMRKLLQSSR